MSALGEIRTPNLLIRSWLLSSQIKVMSFHQRRSEWVLCSAVVENSHGCSKFRDIFCDTNETDDQWKLLDKAGSQRSWYQTGDAVQLG